MTHDGYFEYYQKLSNWDFDTFEIETESLTNWDLYDQLRRFAKPDSKVLDLGTGGGEKLLAFFPDCAEILGTDYSPAMIATANENLKKSGRKNISFRVMDNLKMDVPDCYFDVVVARHTVTDPVMLRKCLKPGGHLFIRGVDKYDCWALKLMCQSGQGFYDPVPLSIVEYEGLMRAGFRDVELVPIHEKEFFKTAESFKAFIHKVPILEKIDDELLDRYIEENTFDGRIRLIRRYYGITAVA